MATGTTGKLELDFESLKSSLRQSWRKEDLDQATTVLSELGQLYPDLLVNKDEIAPHSDYYETLKLTAAATEEEVVTGFFRQLHNVLRDKSTPHRSKFYVKLLDAGFILRKPRLRLSHDLAAVSNWLNRNEQSAGAPAVSNAVKNKDQLPEGNSQAVGQPLLLKLLEQSSMISTVEVQALSAQMRRASNVQLDSLVLKAGYVTKEEMASLKLAEMLLNRGHVSLPQVLVALYDERNSGIRMAESLQTRGWLPVQVQ